MPVVEASLTLSFLYQYQYARALEGFYSGGGALGIFPNFFPGRAKSGEIFFPLKTNKTILSC